MGREGSLLRSFLAAQAWGWLPGGVSRQRSQVLSAKGVMLVSGQVRSLPGCQRPELCQVLPYRKCWMYMHLWPIMSGWDCVSTRPQLGIEGLSQDPVVERTVRRSAPMARRWRKGLGYLAFRRPGAPTWGRQIVRACTLPCTPLLRKSRDRDEVFSLTALHQAC